MKKLWMIYFGLFAVLKIAAQDGTATINYTNTQQRIDGFGASSAWMNAPLSTADADLIFSTTSGAGLSLLRTRIAPGGVIDERGRYHRPASGGARRARLEHALEPARQFQGQWQCQRWQLC
jgi:O-glycosyl hydrolase